jgi:Sulfotransferase family
MAAPVIILAPPRSFSTVFSAMLGQHPQLYGLPETHMFGAESVAELLQQFADATYRMADGLLRAVGQICFGRQTEATVRSARGWLARRGHLTTGQLFEVLGRRVYPLALVEKSPSLVYRMTSLKRVWRMFPEARFIHLLRHPAGQGSSALNYLSYVEKRRRGLPPGHWLLELTSYAFRFGDEGDTAQEPRDPQRAWYALNSKICEFLSSVPPEQWIRIRGEDVLHRPEMCLSNIAEWLGVRRDSAAIQEMKHPERSPYACYGPRGAEFGNDVLFLSHPELRTERATTLTLRGAMPWSTRPFHPRVVALAREFGYD